MSQTSWHVSPEALSRYFHDPGSIDDVTASSIETHVVGCATCRSHLTSLTRDESTATSWNSIADRIDRPRATPFEWLLERLGMRDGIARLVAATPALQLAGLAAIALVAAVAVMMSQEHGTGGPFLILAPLAPLAAVYATFAPASDPGGEAGIATPLHGAGVVIRRTAVVLTVTLGALSLAALALPNLDSMAAAWVLPALALSLGAVALATWMHIELAVAILAGGWLTVLTMVSWAGPPSTPIVESATFAAIGQMTALVAILISITVVVARRDTFATLEARS